MASIKATRIDCSVRDPQKHDGHIEYELVCRMEDIDPETSARIPFQWTVKRRYKQFLALDQVLRERYDRDLSVVPFPKKKMLGNKKPEFLEQRMFELQEYMRSVLTIKGISDFEGAEATGCWELREFLEFDKRKQAETPSTAKSADASTAAEAAEATPDSLMSTAGITGKEAVENLRLVNFEGTWRAEFSFELVNIGAAKKDAVVSGLQVGSFGPGTGAGRGRGRGRRSSAVALLKRNTVRPGSKLAARMDLAAAGGGYLKGAMGSFGQFGKDGKVTGSVQRTSGRISLQVQVKRAETTTSFNLICVAVSAHELVGTFTGCEISRSAGTVSGQICIKLGGETIESEGEESPDVDG